MEKAASKLAVYSVLSHIHLQINNAYFNESNQFLKAVPLVLLCSLILWAVALFFFFRHRGHGEMMYCVVFTVNVARTLIKRNVSSGSWQLNGPSVCQ